MNMRDIMTVVSQLMETRRGLARIGEMNTKVFWNPRHADLMAMLSRSKLGDVRGSYLKTNEETLIAIWPARNLGHWNFHNECLKREGINATQTVDFRVGLDYSVLTDERYWSKSTHYKGNGFYCAFYDAKNPNFDPNTIPQFEQLFGPLSVIENES